MLTRYSQSTLSLQARWFKQDRKVA